MSDVMDTVVCIQSNEMNNISSPHNLAKSFSFHSSAYAGMLRQRKSTVKRPTVLPLQAHSVRQHGLDWFQRTIHRAHKSHYSLESSSMLPLNRLNSLHVQTGAARIYDTLASRPASGWYSSEAGLSLCLNRSCCTNFSVRVLQQASSLFHRPCSPSARLKARCPCQAGPPDRTRRTTGPGSARPPPWTGRPR